jgi:hypothetical protein
MEGGNDPATLEVHFKLTDLEYHPLPGTAVRLVFGFQPGWQNPDAGRRFVTDANGEYRFRTTAVIDQRHRKKPTNFVSSLLSRRRNTDHVAVAAELEYLGFRWLYALDLYRFPDGTAALLDGFSVYTQDALGRFTIPAAHDASGWRMADLNGMALTTAGYEPWDFLLQSDPPRQGWSVRLAFKQSPPPILR